MDTLRRFGPELVSNFQVRLQSTNIFFVGANEFLSSWYFDCHPERCVLTTDPRY